MMEWVAIPFGLCNAPATFHQIMHETLRYFLHKFLNLYLGDVCIYIRALEEYTVNLRLVLQRFKEEGLKLRLKKFFFGLHEMKYLAYTISGGKLSISTKRVEAVKEWVVPKIQREARSFV
jgi:hypothetical protein